MSEQLSIIRYRPRIITLKDDLEVFGEVEEITPNVAKIILWDPDFLHYHESAEETYIGAEGEGEIFLDGEIFQFTPGIRVVIRPRIIHAARPKNFLDQLVFLCLSSPCFNPDDVHNDPRGREW